MAFIDILVFLFIVIFLAVGITQVLIPLARRRSLFPAFRATRNDIVAEVSELRDIGNGEARQLRDMVQDEALLRERDELKSRLEFLEQQTHERQEVQHNGDVATSTYPFPINRPKE